MIVAVLLGSFAVLAATMVGMMRHDLRWIQLERARHAHPQARRWRKRPAIAVTDSPETNNLKRQYRNLRTSTTTPGDLALSLPPGSALHPTSLRSSAWFVAAHPRTPTIIILPQLALPSTTGALFRTLYLILAAPFALARSGLGITAGRSDYPTLTNHDVAQNRTRNMLYMVGKWVVGFVNIGVFSYSLYLAAVLEQPAVLLIYSLGFGLWALWTIGRYPYLSFRHKLFYVLLLPATPLYFIYRLIVAPLRIVL